MSPRLSNELVEPRFGDDAVAVLVDVEAVRITRCLPIEQDAEPGRGHAGRRREDEVQVTRVEAVRDAAVRRVAHRSSRPSVQSPASAHSLRCKRDGTVYSRGSSNRGAGRERRSLRPGRGRRTSPPIARCASRRRISMPRASTGTGSTGRSTAPASASSWRMARSDHLVAAFAELMVPDAALAHRRCRAPASIGSRTHSKRRSRCRSRPGTRCPCRAPRGARCRCRARR